MSPTVKWLAVAALVAVLLFSLEDPMFSVDVDKVRAALRDAAWDAGVAPDLMDAIGKVESKWNIDAVNANDPGGGAWGPTQLLGSTLRNLGFTGSLTDLTTDPKVAGYWSARYMASRPGGAPSSVDDAAAWWNAGRAHFSDLPADHPTRTTYAPALRDALTYVYSHPLPLPEV